MKIRIILENNRFINIQLDANKAPITVQQFLRLVDEHYYDNVIFHRVIKDFMIQTGAYYLDDKTLKQKAKQNTIKGEFLANGCENDIKHLPGVISMARSSDFNSASTQFFICSSECPHLDGQYAAFGKVLDEESMQTVIDLSMVETIKFHNFFDFPKSIIKIKTIERI